MDQRHSYILWYNSSTGETEFWYMDKHRLVGRGTVLEENGSAAFAGPPFRIVGTGDFDGDGSSDILLCNTSTGEMQLWSMDGHRLIERRTVVAEDGNALLAGPPFTIAGTADFYGSGTSDILLRNGSTGAMQVCSMDGHRVVDRRTVVAEDGKAVLIGPPTEIVGAADFSGNGQADILCYDSSIGETQIWSMDGYRLVRRDTVIRDNGNAVFIGSPHMIMAAADFDGNGSADIVWYNSFTGQADVWYMDHNFVLGRGTVLGFDSTIAFTGPPLSIVGAGTSLMHEAALADRAATGRRAPGPGGVRIKAAAQASFESNM
jgi:hypothetical protein